MGAGRPPSGAGSRKKGLKRGKARAADSAPRKAFTEDTHAKTGMSQRVIQEEVQIGAMPEAVREEGGITARWGRNPAPALSSQDFLRQDAPGSPRRRRPCPWYGRDSRGAEIKPQFAAMARERMLAGKAADPSANLREGSEPSRKASDDAAAAVNISARSIEAAIGRRYNRAKKPVGSTGGDHRSERANRRNQNGNVDRADGRTRVALAKEHGVGMTTVLRAGKFAAAVETPGASTWTGRPTSPSPSDGARAYRPNPDMARRLIFNIESLIGRNIVLS